MRGFIRVEPESVNEDRDPSGGPRYRTAFPHV